jgi:BASS family bile acid:Na+ symporter
VKELIIEIIKIVAPLAVALVVFAQGLSISKGAVWDYFRERRWLIVRSLIAAIVLAPVAALALILVLKPPLPVAVGLAILVSCPPAPLMISAAPKVGRGSVAFMASLHLCLASLAFVTVPTVLYLMSIPLGFRATVQLGPMVWILARTIVLPLILGIFVRGVFPAFADRRGRAIGMAGSVGLALVVLVAVVALYPMLLKTDLRSYLVMAAVGAAALAIGHLLGPADSAERTALAVECGVRHPVLALTIGAANFSLERALPVLLPSVLTFILVAIAYLLIRARTTAAIKPGSAGSAS